MIKNRTTAALWAIIVISAVGIGSRGRAATTVLPGTTELKSEGDLSAEMIAGIERYLDGGLAQSIAERGKFWKRDFASAPAYESSIAPNRERLRRILGAADERVKPVRMEYVSGPDQSALVAESSRIRVFAVRWTVLEGVTGEGLLLEPKGKAVARIVALPDADQTPEMLAGLKKAGGGAFGRRLAEAGCEVLVPTLIDRQCTWSGNPRISMTDQTHREWIWRQAFDLGRHVIGFEVQKVAAAVDWLRSRDTPDDTRLPIGVAGYGEGGLIAFCAAALDPRIDAALVSGTFQPREALWSEPIYRNVWSLLREFGDAEIASLIAPRALVIEHSEGPRVDGPPKVEASRRKTAAPGTIVPPDFTAVRGEVERARTLTTGPDSRALGSIE
ncbi:MAG: dienelactone hydrolase family protein, partial [Steroidobacteraceae bacterium]